MDVMKEFLKMNEDVITHLSKLDPSKVYIFEIDTDASFRDVFDFCNQLKDAVERFGIKAIYIPKIEGIKNIKISELSKYEEGGNKDVIQ